MEHIPPEHSELAQHTLHRLAPVGSLLHRAMEPSIVEAQQFFDGRRYDDHLFASLCRYYTACRLEQRPMPADTRFRRIQNNGMIFRRKRCIAAVYKANCNGELYGPGRSKAKQQYFSQYHLFSQLADPAQYRYAIIWEHTEAAGLLLSIACPKSWEYFRSWQKADCHFYIEFPDAASGLKADDAFFEEGTDIDLWPKRDAASMGDDDDDGFPDDDQW